MTTRSLADIAKLLSAKCVGDGQTLVSGVGSIERGLSGEIGFIADPRYLKQLERSAISAVIVSPTLADQLDRPGLVSRNPHADFVRVVGLFDDSPEPVSGVHPSAIIAESASISPSAIIGPGCIVEREVSIAAGTHLVARVTVCHGTIIGENCIIHPGAVIGSDGFGYAPDGERWVKVPQIGVTRIGNNCEIGANTTIDRGALDDTVIGEGVKIDNLVQIAHNVIIGDHTAIAGCVGIAGSARLGKRCRIGGNAGVLGHLDVCDDVTIMAKSLVTKSIREPGIYSSAIPATDQAHWGRQLARIRRLDAMAERVSKLENNDTD